MQIPSSSGTAERRSSASLSDATDPAWGAVLCDLDGCLISGNTLLPGVQAFAHEVQDRLWIVSNNSSDTPQSLACKLAGLGLPIAPRRVLLAGAEAIVDLASRRPGARLALFASQVLRDHAETHGLHLDEIRPEAVLLCRDIRFDYAALTRIVMHLEQGAELVVANPDASHPSLAGPPMPETGALLAAILTVLPDQPVRIIGKPERFLFDVALKRAGVPPSKALMIGDNARTDGAGARALGIAYAEMAPNAGFAHLTGGESCCLS